MQPFSVFSFLFLLTSSWSALADTTYSQSSDYSSGVLGRGPFQTFKSSSSTPSTWNFVVPYNDSTVEQIEPGLVFLAPRGTDVKSHGALIYDKHGDLIWDGTQFGETLTFRTATYKNNPVILLWTGAIQAIGVGFGYDLIINNKYQVIANFTSDLNGTLADFHDISITSNDTALITVYQPKPWDLSMYNISGGWLLDSVAQEVDPSTGKALFTWIASDHIDVNSCFAAPGSSGTSESNPWDFFHINSIDKDNLGNYLISSRHCHTLFYVGPDGNTIWTIGGKNSSVTMNNVTFAWQHDARFRNNRQQISLFDNEGSGWETDASNSRGLLLDLDEAGNTVSLHSEFLPFNTTVSASQGNVGMLNSGNAIVGWGAVPYFSEYNANGEFLYAVQFGVGDVQSYRAYTFNWTGAPTTQPSVFVETDGSNTTVYSSWNGATSVATWQLSGSTVDSPQLAVPITNFSRSGFETMMPATNTSKNFKYYQVAALNSNKKIIAYSRFTAADGSSKDVAANQTLMGDGSSSGNGTDSGQSSSGAIQIQSGNVLPLLAFAMFWILNGLI